MVRALPGESPRGTYAAAGAGPPDDAGPQAARRGRGPADRDRVPGAVPLRPLRRRRPGSCCRSSASLSRRVRASDEEPSPRHIGTEPWCCELARHLATLESRIRGLNPGYPAAGRGPDRDGPLSSSMPEAVVRCPFRGRRRDMRHSSGCHVHACLLGVAAAATARAELSYRVVLLRPPITDDVTSDALARVRGELTAAGFEVSMLDQDPALGVRTALETVGRELDPIAAFANRARGRPTTPRMAAAARSNRGEVRHPERAPGRGRNDGRVARRTPSRASVVLAVEAVGLLKARPRANIGSPRNGARAAAARGNRHRRRRAAPPARVTAGLGIEAGVGLLDNAGAVGRGVAARRARSYGGARGWTAASPSPAWERTPSCAIPTAARKSSRRSASWSSCAAFAPGRGAAVPLHGRGAYRARRRGCRRRARTSAARRGTPGRRWALRAAGSSCRWCRRVALVAAAQVGLTVPDNVIRVGGNGAEAAPAGPSLFASAGRARFWPPGGSRARRPAAAPGWGRCAGDHGRSGSGGGGGGGGGGRERLRDAAIAATSPTKAAPGARRR